MFMKVHAAAFCRFFFSRTNFQHKIKNIFWSNEKKKMARHKNYTGAHSRTAYHIMA